LNFKEETAEDAEGSEFFLNTEGTVAASRPGWNPLFRTVIGATLLVAGTVVASAALAATFRQNSASRRLSRSEYQPTRSQFDYDRRRLAEKGPIHPDLDCYTVDAKDGGKPFGDCYAHSLWAKYHGIKDHPDWYIKPHNLHDTSPLESFQYYIYQHKLHDWACPQPCPTGTLVIYYDTKADPSGKLTGEQYPSLKLKYGDCTFDGDNGANMVVGDFAPYSPGHDKNLFVHVHHYNNVFCTDKPSKSWFLFTDGQRTDNCCAANGTSCGLTCTAANQ
jgi:hypothetical protein